MPKLLGFIGATIGGSVGWWLGAKVGIMTAFILSIIATGVGGFYAKRYGDSIQG